MLNTSLDTHAHREVGRECRGVLRNQDVEPRVKKPTKDLTSNLACGVIEMGHESIRIIWWKEKGPVLLPLALGRKEGQTGQHLLVFMVRPTERSSLRAGMTIETRDVGLSVAVASDRKTSRLMTV